MTTRPNPRARSHALIARARASVRYRQRVWLRRRRHRFELEPMETRPGLCELRSDAGEPPRRVTVFTFDLRSPTRPGPLSGIHLFAVDASGHRRLVHQFSATGRAGPVRRLVMLPPKLERLLCLVDTQPEVLGGVEALELGSVPLTGHLVKEWLEPGRRTPRRIVRGARRAASIARRKGIQGVVDHLTSDHVAARRKPRERAGRRTPLLADLEKHHRLRARGELREFLDSGRLLDVPRAEDPDLSVVLVTWNGAEYTLRCLGALVAATLPPVELIVVDNASTDETGRLLERVDGAIVERNDANVGFVRACNQAADLARGRNLLLLNPDTEVDAQAVAAAIACLDQHKAGVVGGKLVRLDGSLQEAGSIVWSDGWCEGYGRGENPDHLEYQYRRPVDFVSGAFLLTPSDVWSSLGGFDEAYAPAYYEDVDYCFRVRAAGLDVWYEPAARVLHVEHGSSSPSRAVELMERHHDRFVERHAEALDAQHLASAGNRLRASVAGLGRPRYLVVDDRVPFHDVGGGAPRMTALLRALVDAGVRVTFYSKLDPWDPVRDIYEEVPREVEVILGTGLDRLADVLEARRGLFDTIVVSRLHNFVEVRRLLESNPDLADGARIVYDAEALESRRSGGVGLSGDGSGPEFPLADTLEQEAEHLSFADHVVTVSDGERLALRTAGCRSVAVVSHAVTPAAETPGASGRSGLLFVGNLALPGLPNVEALRWFGREVLPRIHDELARIGRPLIRLRAIGRTTDDVRELLAVDGIDLVGAIADLAPEYGRARAFVAPSRLGAGIPIKVIESAAYGLPVVATPLLARQLGWGPDELMVGGDSPQSFARSVLELLDDDDEWIRVQAGAFSAVQQQFSPAVFRESVAAAFGL